jgi:multidrug efflux system outer membrane protein
MNRAFIPLFMPILTSLIAAMVLAGCSVAPLYEKPAVATPAAFKEAGPGWKTARPAEHERRGPWWTRFDDPRLDELIAQAQAANQDLKAGAARLAQSRAIESGARAAYYPRVDAGTAVSRQRVPPGAAGLAQNADGSSATLWSTQVGIGYEADLFGRVSSTVDAAGADLQRDAALFESLQLAIQADVAQAYFLLRELDAESGLYSRTLELRGQSLGLLERRFAAGDIGEVDIARSRTELASAQSEALGIARRRAVAEHALAILLGRAPSELSLPAMPLQRVTLDVPGVLPSSLLERRPDIAAAERAMAAANSRIGAARAAFYPQLNLGASAGFQAARLSDLFNWSSRTFLLGPLAGTMLSLPIFDGGARRAELRRADAVYEEEVARYRQTVLQAFGEVEDNLANLRLLERQAVAQRQAVEASQRTSRLSQIQYREGSAGFLDVIDADRSVLAQQRLAVQLEGERARSTVSLIRAVGGAWEGDPVAR